MLLSLFGNIYLVIKMKKKYYSYYVYIRTKIPKYENKWPAYYIINIIFYPLIHISKFEIMS